jgi:hypothetical protein
MQIYALFHFKGFNKKDRENIKKRKQQQQQKQKSKFIN